MRWTFYVALLGVLSACGTVNHNDVSSTPLPPLTDYSLSLAEINPATGADVVITLNQAESKKSCRFSSFQRKNTIGYELDDSRHIGFNISPSFDIFNPTDIEVKIGFKFTKAIGGAALKRPDCTFGSGYYGLLPYATNQGFNFNGLTDVRTLKGFVQEKLDDREKRQIKRESKSRSL